MASGVYNRAKANMMNKETDFETDTIKAALMNNSHSFTATHNTFSDVSANEISGTGYSSGGVTLSGKTVTQGATTTFDATDPAWAGAAFTAYHIVFYDTSVSNNLICSIDLGGAQTVNTGTFTVQLGANGILSVT